MEGEYEICDIPFEGRFGRMMELARAIIARDAAPPDFDWITEIWFRNREAYDAMLAAHANPSIGGQIDRDEENFLDRTKTRFFIVEEHGTTA